MNLYRIYERGFSLDDKQAERARAQVWKTLNYTERVIRDAKQSICGLTSCVLSRLREP